MKLGPVSLNRLTGLFCHFLTKQKLRNLHGCEVSVGGDKEDRTPDLLNAIQALSQLSYTPD